MVINCLGLKGLKNVFSTQLMALHPLLLTPHPHWPSLLTPLPSLLITHSFLLSPPSSLPTVPLTEKVTHLARIEERDMSESRDERQIMKSK